MENAVIGVFDTYSHARDAADALTAAGFREWAVQVTPTEESSAARSAALDHRRHDPPSEGWSIGSFFRTLFGTEAEHEHAHSYSEALRRGSFLVTVEAEGDSQLQQAREVMGRYHPIDIEERAAHWRSQGWSRYEPHSAPYSDEEIRMERSRHGAATPSGATVDPTSAVRSYTPYSGAEPPRTGHGIQQTQAVGGGAGFGADTRSEPTGSGGTLGRLSDDNADLHESSGTMSNAAMRDSTAPDIYTLDRDTDFRTHWQKSAGVSEGRYEDFAPAYRFGVDLRKNESFRDLHNWNEVEPEARRSWESNSGASPWEQAKDAVRYAWEKAKG